MTFDEADRMVAEAQTLLSSECDFSMGTWEFEINQTTKVGGGRYAVIPHALWESFVNEYIFNKQVWSLRPQPAAETGEGHGNS